MSVFFRWGVFGILAVAALLYAYNASKSLAEKHEARSAPVVSQGGSGSDEEDEALEDDDADEPAEAESVTEELVEMPAPCEEERLVAERALKYRRDGEPLDRLMRIHTIVFQNDPKRRERLEAVARQWYEREGRDPDAAALRGEVLRDCRRFMSAP
jgi:hypothetical protein